jgi:hypothetical protein
MAIGADRCLETPASNHAQNVSSFARVYNFITSKIGVMNLLAANAAIATGFHRMNI